MARNDSHSVKTDNELAFKSAKRQARYSVISADPVGRQSSKATDWNNRKLLELIKMAATPIDFDRLIADRVLRRHGGRYELLDLARLPEHARRKIRIVATSRKTPNPVVSFHKPSKQAVQQAKRMGLLSPD